MAERPMESESYARPASTCAAELENLSPGFLGQGRGGGADGVVVEGTSFTHGSQHGEK